MTGFARSAGLATPLHRAAPVVRLLAFIEALGVTGPLRNLLEFAPHADLHLATYRRSSLGEAHLAGVGAMAEAARAARVPVHVLEECHPFDPRLPRAAAGLIARIRPDIVQSHNIKSHAIVASARAGTPWIAWHHGYTDSDLRVRVYNRMDRWSLRRADLVVTTCGPFAEALARHGVERTRIRVVHNAVPAQRPLDRTMAREALGVSDRSVILAVGRLSREKGHDVLLDAVGAMGAPRRERLLILVAGDGPERDGLRRRAERLGVNARFDGHTTDVARYYAAADVFALPSRSEGSPNALLEAMGAGCPIVAARVGGVPELADDRSAVLVPPGDPRALGEGLVRLLDDPGLARRLGASARAASSRFTRERRAAQLLSIYDSLVTSPEAVGAR